MFQSRSLRMVGALLGTLAFILTACSKKTNTGTGSSPSTSGKPTYTIAYQGPLSGGNQQLGIYMDNAVKLAINQANAGTTFGTLPFTLKFEDEDDQGSADVAPTAATKLIDDNNVVAVIGPAFSGATQASEPDFQQAGLASISPSATLATLTTHGWTNFFRVVANDNIQAAADASYMAKVVKATSVYVVNDASAYGQPLAAAFASDAQTDGMKVTTNTAPGTTQCQAGSGSSTEYPALASEVVSSKAGALFYGGYYCDLALFVKALNAAGYKGTIMSDDGSENTQLITQAGQTAAQGILTSCACATTLGAGAGAAFDTAYMQAYNSAAGTYSAESYDATNAVISVMKGMTGTITRADVVKAIASVDYMGITKEIKFTSTGDIAGQAVYMYKVEGANLTQLGLVSALLPTS
ncbi:MAG TPA: branched-chain amino acid ABC transporter substrate-binding protein [Acidimicrobiia bacterium]|nr:branched-chain amino acid ABC transporter substrate-binding protein [Acidimicrobiia bacterium]